MKHAVRWLALTALALVVACALLVGAVHVEGAPREFETPRAVPAETRLRVAIVFGAGLNPDGSATALLRDRVATAVELYKLGRVKLLLLTGDNRIEQHNEPLAMTRVALDLGVPRNALVADFAG
ncbi:MAG: YdcF family protein, partial [Chloroflexi bacterium]|nr:YdcF family protein [Chloroflexota bacterium]